MASKARAVYPGLSPPEDILRFKYVVSDVTFEFQLDFGLRIYWYLAGYGVRLYGVLSAQTMYYFKTYPKDPPVLKILSVFHAIELSYIRLTKLPGDLDYGSPEAWQHTTDSEVSGALATVIVQSWYQIPLTVTMVLNVIVAGLVPSLLQPFVNLLADILNTVMLLWMLSKNKSSFKTYASTRVWIGALSSELVLVQTT
ncbi:hypothetical protein WOLCODRAFT_142827 [Wolfiporia cocos MD-104 SS10]|uniref:Uncharacterized protein n=1 Tax=Wolfiporia cocos (strain MD-104) TaxID=742152 RepID=A0A2H3JUU8_WOLCO|nr:hypothetical protein WOLCODRAFT_142827 [Wolfiporia cocos MD-104 SS10]